MIWHDNPPGSIQSHSPSTISAFTFRKFCSVSLFTTLANSPSITELVEQNDIIQSLYTHISNTPIMMTFGLVENCLYYIEIHHWNITECTVLLLDGAAQCSSLWTPLLISDWFPAMTKLWLISLWPAVIIFEFHSVHFVHLSLKYCY